mmetsp:Transcript_11859/g.24939  ORF Transcript_11859/g.24939 Transcript_11859/m.24939 type:complete len:272 (-) Transcript_11859:450-1265(-)|eukprot:CAMPEP_0118945402 /NCGR_PEP_ID=MMETSP1169-20130426/42184_1 /TAXON_ID=36882 /ORGANISM="Pyramimonas obovata, Strain CCMP722" /LENGTH=271 /DNA_ID=CAMNT_0006891107 /DNA_START=119 /DNA_END=934 /DNA_ORIENTATION=-
MTVFVTSPKKIIPRTSSWGPSIGAPNGHGVFQCIDTTTAYVAKLEKITKDQNARILQLEAELKEQRKAKSTCTEKLLACEEQLSRDQYKMQEEGKLYEASIAVARDDKELLEITCTQLRRDLASLEGQVLAACQQGQVDPTSVWKPTIMEVANLKHEIEIMAQEHVRTCQDNNALGVELKAVQNDMLLALDRIHTLVTLNEPHQSFVANIMRERNFWQDLAKRATRQIDEARLNEETSGSTQAHYKTRSPPRLDLKSPKSPNVRRKKMAGF